MEIFLYGTRDFGYVYKDDKKNGLINKIVHINN